MLRAIIYATAEWPTELKALWVIITAAVIGYVVTGVVLSAKALRVSERSEDTSK